MNYKSSGIDYDQIDQFKRLAQRWGRKTSGKTESIDSRGESAFVWEEKDCYRALVVEGLGTKNLVADAMRKITGKTYYDTIAQDAVAMIVNDLITVGASPQVINAYFAVGDSRWFEDTRRVRDLVRGWARACALAGAVWGGGETPSLKGIIASDAIDLAGSAVGIIKPKKRLLCGKNIQASDAIIIVESSGIHANGLTLARAIADKLPKSYATKLSDGTMYGEALLRPTHIYARLIEALFHSGIDIHYTVNITGHGWRKLMRPREPFTYTIESFPRMKPLFSFLQDHGQLSDRQMYETFNMGAGFALYIPEKDVTCVIAIAKQQRLRAWHAGIVIKGTRQVVIKPNGIVFEGETLKIRN